MKPEVGKIIQEVSAERDAIHVAIAPVVAGENLAPGTVVTVAERGHVAYEALVDSEVPVGIVDPFLKHYVLKGEKFWLFLYPGQAENLRHEWKSIHFPESRHDEPFETGYAECSNC